MSRAIILATGAGAALLRSLPVVRAVGQESQVVAGHEGAAALDLGPDGLSLALPDRAGPAVDDGGLLHAFLGYHGRSVNESIC